MAKNRDTSPKIAGDLQKAMSALRESDEVPVIVRYRRNASMKLPKAPGVQVTKCFSTFPAIAAKVPAAQIDEIAQEESIERLWLDFQVFAYLDRSVPAVGGPPVWAAGVTGKGVTIAILDTGIDLDHPDFEDRIVGAFSFVPPAEENQRFSRYSSGHSDTASTIDRNGHGTHVAGIAASSGAASGGRYRGIAPEANLLIAKVLDDNGGGAASNVIAGLEWAFKRGAQVACLSLGGSEAGDGTDALSVACDEYSELGLVICVAAGNSGPRRYTIGPPGCAKEVITVGAADIGSTEGAECTVAPFSSRGPTSDRRVKPDLLFPGVGVVSCRAREGYLGEPVAEFGEYYVRASGTSMATPLAAGSCALLLQVVPEATPRQVKMLLSESAVDLGDSQFAQGSGLANVSAALKVAASKPPSPIPDHSQPQGCLTSLVPALARLHSGH